ncbi:TonB-dependent siderophore receptor [Pseudoalteromonas luteoviolacea]|uniref:TonB-denpendent receptor n=1 Tax=Pseudoalteromonas luteoviolacea H33 TaxID=1365251 RepID=A0A167EPX3_9GAMM|nr:TonB-dependent siderophore receptor [Pseudoalteromonas luteoviolacea]KZN51058.1 hypothetical protein N476_14280 [Pseudoalteromonas luteoviolacea H33]KZN72149.1 hypothetical protein N477_03145 [Pseudoalteromonas luteoviolacea H33-S]MBQ4878446.1 TonB-dependent siderophore receptor [Pseudoalteromonas luteoviolacea]MBQ4907601.1 TonB-dependent siderophore receptor [Pseudoalteromonas luteoviolacea]
MKQYSMIAKAVCIGLLASSSSVVLADDAKLDMERIEVVGKHHRDVGATGLPLAIGDTPQSISVIDREFMDFHDINSIGDALTHSAGVYSETSLDSRERFVFARGFEMNRFLIDGMGTAARANQATMLDTSVFETVEVIRGSTGMLQEIGQPSGTVNLVQKRAYNGTGGYVTAEYGSWNKMRAEADFNTTLTDSGSVRARAVVALEDMDSFVDRYNADRKTLYTTLSADITDALQVSVFASYQDDGQTAKSDGLPLQFANGDPIEIGIEANIYPDWGTQDSTQDSLMGELRYQINSDWSVVAKLYQSSTDENKVYTGLDWHPAPNGDYAVFTDVKDADYESDRAELGVNGQFDLFGQTHTLNVTVADTNFEELNYQYRPLSRVTGNLAAEHRNESPEPKPAKPDYNYDNPILRTADIGSQSARAALNLQVLDNVNVLLGANRKEVTSYSNIVGTITDKEFSDTSLYYGGVYKVNEQVTVYASYTDIFDQPLHYDKAGKLLDPVRGENQEVGFRFSNSENTLSVDVAYFNITQENFAVVAGKDENQNVYYSGQSGVESEGYEVEVSGYFTEQWFASLSFSDTDVTNPNENEGRVSRVVPEKMASFSTFYEFDSLRVGGYVNYAGEREGFTGFGPIYDYVPVDSHVLAGFSAYYEFNESLSAKFNIHNLFDKEYDAKIAFISVRPGDPRNFSAQVTYTF